MLIPYPNNSKRWGSQRVMGTREGPCSSQACPGQGQQVVRRYSTFTCIGQLSCHCVLGMGQGYRAGFGEQGPRKRNPASTVSFLGTDESSPISLSWGPHYLAARVRNLALLAPWP